MRTPLVLAALVTLFVLPPLAHGQGVGVIDASAGTYLRLDVNDVRATVENQVAVVTTRQTFRNLTDDTVAVKYAFPTPGDATPTALRWEIGGTWYDAQFAPAPQDTTLPGSGGGAGLDPDLRTHLGATPLFFEIEQPVGPDATLVVELDYVQLLPYANGNVDFHYPNDYSLIQTQVIERQAFAFSLTSPRWIEVLDLKSHLPTATANDGTTATLFVEAIEARPAIDYHVQYRLSQEELGLFSFSTQLPDSVVADERAPGFFAFVAEPDPREGVGVIEKVFTLIVDRSGSMSGEKMRQARAAAAFVVDNLNPGDRFNIVDFSNVARSFRAAHVAYTEETRQAALAYIDDLVPGGGTDIGGAFSAAVPPFAAAGANTANIIIFFTDGRPTLGIQDTDPLLEHVAVLISELEADVSVFTFGVGEDVARPLLTQLASANEGIVAFLEDDQLEARVTEFYLTIRNPVLLNTEITFTPDVITDVYPTTLPNLYKGQQMIVAGRYDAAQPVEVTLRGQAFGQPVSYSYTLDLAEAPVERFRFLTKVWAKLKIEELLVRYYAQEGTEAAEILREEIVALSLGFGVITPFTSFQGGVETGNPDDGGPGGGGQDGGDAPVGVEEDPIEAPRTPVVLLGNHPNPFSTSTTLRFRLETTPRAPVLVKIYDTLGRLVRVLAVPASGPGVAEVVWDGRTADGRWAPSGTYLYVIAVGDAVLTGTMTLVR